MDASSHATAQLLTECRKAAKEAKWDSALKLIERALRACGSTDSRTRITILDTRVAVRLRMSMPALALQDAKGMIRSDKSDGRGYVRCGQIEQEQGNAPAALKWYEQGLKHVQPTSQYFATISAEASKAQERIRVETMNSKPIDPMQTLPLELAERVLSFVSYKQHVRMLRVCKGWDKLLRSLRPLTDTLAFPSPSRDINSKMLHAALRRLKRPTAIHISRLQPAASEVLGDRMQYWQNWQRLAVLEVHDRRFASWNLPLPKFDLRTIKLQDHNAIPFSAVQQILRDCTHLETAMFSKVAYERSLAWENPPTLHGPELRSLQISVATSTAATILVNLSTMFARMSRLESLQLENIDGGRSVLELRHIENLRHLTLTGLSVGEIRLPPSLESLELYHSAAHPGDHTDPFSSTRLPHLGIFSVVDCSGLPRLLSKAIAAENIVQLTWVFARESEEGRFLKDLVDQGRLKGVRDLHLKIEDLCDSRSSTFVRGLPKLETLCVEEAMITGAFISDLIEGNGKLRKATLIQCPKVSGDIVPWSKARGVQVERVNSINASGRRVVEETR
ncbi:hypothetical protein PV08_03700 [Exophiala spinifera]|uniref:F-box domain-containing protein n=1 Tax=Exophiala spinifera TaxID=91928 RepID=A0A0D2BLF5_9EURO|nr:uncharacterized protein PV08_03700 [Exophiala spinifera]KIW19405.1 hypothetical protein PV08_03700 [Exophiala spinifera]